MKKKLVLLILLYCCHFVNSYYIFDKINNYYCSLFECCNEKTVPYNLQSLRFMLDTKLYGQHMAAEVVLNAINSHVSNPNPRRPLVMSFHGSNGGGKSYVSRMIAKAFYRDGENSNYFHFYYGLENFPSDSKNKIAEYQVQLKSNIEKAISKCERSLFIFDGVDYMPTDLLDAIMPFVDCSHCGNKMEKNKSIFILLSNTGSKAIEQKLLKEMRAGINRESVTLKDFQGIIISEVFSQVDGPFYESKLIKSDAIDFYVPFLPLEKVHVEKCIKEAFEEWNSTSTKELIEEVIQELRFGPGRENFFSISGCKRVDTIVGRVNARLNPLFNDFDSDKDRSSDEL